MDETDPDSVIVIPVAVPMGTHCDTLEPEELEKSLPLLAAGTMPTAGL